MNTSVKQLIRSANQRTLDEQAELKRIRDDQAQSIVYLVSAVAVVILTFIMYFEPVTK